MKTACTIGLAWVCLLVGDRCSAQPTNYYHFERTFIPCPHSPGAPTRYKIIAGARELSGIVGPTNICIISNGTQATEYDVVGLGYGSPEEAWSSALATWSSCSSNQPGMIYDNVGWVKVTHEAYSNWGAYIWCLQNTIAFTSSASSVYVSPAGATSAIASVLVGTIGDFCPQTVVTDVGPVFNTNYPGSGMATDYMARVDLTAYYKLVSSNYLAVNDDDSDGDGVPDFADGYDRDGQANSPDDLSVNDFFASWPVLLSGYADPAQAMVSISYNASDPSGVTVGTNGYVPASGCFRLWRTNAARARNGASILSGGDYISPGTYPAASLGFSARPQLVDFFIEPVAPVLNQALVIEVDPDGPGPMGSVCVDKQECTLLKVELTNIKFNHDAASSASDALNIRQDYNTAFDISNGEWVKGGTNISACYTTNKAVTIKARFTVQPAGITSADIWAVSTDPGGSLGDVIKTNVTFAGGVSVGDTNGYVYFQVAGTTPDCIKKTTADVWQWKMENANGTGSAACDLNTSGVHTVYTILNEPVTPWNNAWSAGNNPSNAWTTALDFTIVNALCNGDSSGSDAMAHITHYLHDSNSITGHGLTYDINGGSPQYKLGPTFHLSSYMTKTAGNVVNCYDQAGGVTTCSRLLGIASEYVFMGYRFPTATNSRFGYILATDLVGIGQCNNPFYPTTANPANRVPLLGSGGVTDLVGTNRTFFGNHAFARFGGVIFDACAGPHLGTETLTHYATVAIDITSVDERAVSPDGSVSGGDADGAFTDAEVTDDLSADDVTEVE